MRGLQLLMSCVLLCQIKLTNDSVPGSRRCVLVFIAKVFLKNKRIHMKGETERLRYVHTFF